MRRRDHDASRPTAAGDRDRYSSLRLLERRQRHGLGGDDAEYADAGDQCEREKSVHSCLLWFFTLILTLISRPDVNFAPLGAF
jgi:hypothetical protein